VTTGWPCERVSGVRGCSVWPHFPSWARVCFARLSILTHTASGNFMGYDPALLYSMPRHVRPVLVRVSHSSRQHAPLTQIQRCDADCNLMYTHASTCTHAHARTQGPTSTCKHARPGAAQWMRMMGREACWATTQTTWGRSRKSSTQPGRKRLRTISLALYPLSAWHTYTHFSAQ